MQSVCFLNLYELPERRKDEPKKLNERLYLSSNNEGYNPQLYVTIGLEGTDIQFIILGQQIIKAVKNASNTVRGCLDVQNTLNVFKSVPTIYEQKISTQDTIFVNINSTSLSTFVNVVLPGPYKLLGIIKAEELLAAVENVIRI